MPMPKTDKEKEIYQQMLEDYKDDKIALATIEDFKQGKKVSMATTWEDFEMLMAY